MADGALHPTGGGAVFLGDFRVQALGHGIDVIRFIHRQEDGVPQELVALDVGRDTDLVQNLGNGQLVAVHAGLHQNALLVAKGHLENPAGQNIFVKRLDEIVREALIQQFLHHFFTLERTCHKKRGVALPGGIVLLFDGQCVQSRHKCIQKDHLRPHGEHFLQDFQPVFLHDRHLDAFELQRLAAGCRDFCTGIRHQKFHFIHRTFLQCVLQSVQFP